MPHDLVDHPVPPATIDRASIWIDDTIPARPIVVPSSLSPTPARQTSLGLTSHSSAAMAVRNPYARESGYVRSAAVEELAAAIDSWLPEPVYDTPADGDTEMGPPPLPLGTSIQRSPIRPAVHVADPDPTHHDLDQVDELADDDEDPMGLSPDKLAGQEQVRARGRGSRGSSASASRTRLQH